MTLGALLSVAYGLGWLPLSLFRVEPLWQSLPYYEGRERLAVWLTPSLLSVHVILACLLLRGMRAPSLRVLVAMVLYFTAMGLWFWGRGQIGPLLRRRLPDERPLELRRHGAFGLVRHPLYSSYLGVALAPVIATASPLLALTFAASFVAIAVRAEQEERRLRLQFGDEYNDYARRVPRLIPFVW